jgi:hypothetical protein
MQPEWRSSPVATIQNIDHGKPTNLNIAHIDPCKSDIKIGIFLFLLSFRSPFYIFLPCESSLLVTEISRSYLLRRESQAPNRWK